MKLLDEILRETFPGAGAIVVQDQLHGFRRKENFYILLVEVFGYPEPGPYIVKIGPVEKIERELQGWDCCRPQALRHDLVFLSLRPGYRCPESSDKSQPRLMSLVYGDAQQFIGVETTSAFESAARESICFGSPSLPSIGFVLVELYERIGHLLYSQSFVDDPKQPGYVFEVPRLHESLHLWQSEATLLADRARIDFLVRRGAGHYLDPVDYLRYVLTCVPGQLASASPLPPREDGPHFELPDPRPADVVPRMLRGCAHGDLHGRNVLVGIVRNRALWPTVFDYEDMGPCLLLGWDFVKLETELKIRAYTDIFSDCPESQFIRTVQAFEIDVNEETERHHRDGDWPAVVEGDTPAKRLRAVLIQLRHLAAIHLGLDRGRPKEWLEEYYFLLACYGIITVRYSNLETRQLLASYIAAGVAASRLWWPRQRREQEERLLNPSSGYVI